MLELIQKYIYRTWKVEKSKDRKLFPIILLFETLGNNQDFYFQLTL